METHLQHDLPTLYETNQDKLDNLKSLLESVNTIESNIECKISAHKKYIDTLKTTFQQAINSYHAISKNLVTL
jgi:hypothetical protein